MEQAGGGKSVGVLRAQRTGIRVSSHRSGIRTLGGHMDLLRKLGRIMGVVGVLLCMAGVAARIGGAYYIAGFQVGTLLQGGIAAMVFGCLCFLAVLAHRS